MSSKQPSFARMPRNRGHLEQFCSSILSTHINMLPYQLASYTVDLVANRLVHCTGRTKILPNALHFLVFARTNYFLSILLGNWYFTQQYAFYLECGILLSNRHFTWHFTRQFLTQVQNSRHVPDTIKYCWYNTYHNFSLKSNLRCLTRKKTH